MRSTANEAVAAAFDQIADLLSLQDANPFRVRAYRNGARVLRGFEGDVGALVAAGQPLPKLPGIGADLSERIREIVSTGRCALLEQLRREVPAAVADLLLIPGLGPKKARALYHELHVQTLPQLLRAARDDRVRAVPGFGARSQQRLVEAIESRLSKARRYRISDASAVAERVIAHLRQSPQVKEVTAAGSLRRARDTVGDIDLLAVGDDGKAICDHFLRYPGIVRRISEGGTRASVVLDMGIQVDLRVVDHASAGAALLYFTGSKAHNIALRNLALARGWKLNEYGLYQGRQRIAGESEESVYQALGLRWIAPELRENRGEIEASRDGRLPHLISLGDLAGDLHVHSRWSDGQGSIADMAQAAASRGLQYVAICDHSRRLAVAHGLDVLRLQQQKAEIDDLRRKGPPLGILHGIEVDILADGTLDLPASALDALDIVVAAVHSNFALSREQQTARILRALEGGGVDILAHPLGRLIDEREPYDVDMQAVMGVCAGRKVALELNAHPERLDLLDTWCRVARDAGVPVAINSDAHAPADFDNLRFGIGQARRGWLERRNVLNARALPQLRQWLSQRRGRLAASAGN